MQITPFSLPFSAEALASIAPPVSSVKEAFECVEVWIHAAVTAVEIASVLHTAEDAFLSIADFASTTTVGTLSFLSAVSALHTCMKEGFFSLDGAAMLTSGLKALVSLDQVLNVAAGVGLGLAEFSGVVGVAVSLVTFAKQVRAGDVPGAILTGAKLAATVALTGHPVALAIVLGANAAYALISTYMKVAEESAKHRHAAAEGTHELANKPADEPARTPDRERPGSLESLPAPEIPIPPAAV
ncbi:MULTISPECIES: hypothetical protein [unclassified Bordetella]|uniref:hypothetical protein n=1 Tax=unclassified Bordetella TaxID=2630031 RepID=UPI001324327D|nr:MULTISPECIES: hypothetical protein [unclassified Bordetella]MVW70764.1 hypothetical protein [Bordetella sp. 15P40C-2]MVW80495.1 hypothetical protein [Bordetella sp. 02P26C-1]